MSGRSRERGSRTCIQFSVGAPNLDALDAYRADLDATRLGYGVTVYIFVSLATHSGLNARRFGDLVRAMPEVQEAHAMTGDADYLLKLVVRDLKGLSALVNEVLKRKLGA